MRMPESHCSIQRSRGCEVQLLTPGELKQRFPSMFVDDLGGGLYSPRDGWCDPNGLLQGFRKKAISLGVAYRQDRAAGLARAGAAVTEARLASGAVIRAGAFVNAAGA